ncbi:hypothetical protein MCOR27_002733 [Pyricularia oryzae]|uniref:Uncharacterized protein n=1 Tax=Pyricularia grisea TaxID=148305 RepID=A0ABQ8P014_PYRGI|nr:hypothetical protein MCOR01_007681 [Pyricularia oryzae]KAI6304526.1 hypothetical protein MCOR33_000382 [Pyricularia grisea]KAH9433672.1 hypothetical protein MCOR02_005717 [Pyricularia oryzae]KAI6284604.1 hypothetical protein MCOR27_002733 [Pyricularia oryzae]KAI6315931.1 hypothetical protein MCOR34_004463 [Pyricularia oryzae]
MWSGPFNSPNCIANTSVLCPSQPTPFHHWYLACSCCRLLIIPKPLAPPLSFPSLPPWNLRFAPSLDLPFSPLRWTPYDLHSRLAFLFFPKHTPKLLLSSVSH